jgi:hypothetical protein
MISPSGRSNGDSKTPSSVEAQYMSEQKKVFRTQDACANRKEELEQKKTGNSSALPLTAEAFDSFCKESSPEVERTGRSVQCSLGTKW